MQSVHSVLAALALCALVTSSGAFFPFASYEPMLRGGINGGTPCAVCTIGIALVEQMAEIHNASASESLSKICDLLPKNLQKGCIAIVETYGPMIIELIDNKETPDVVCKAIGTCTGPCNLFPPPKEGMEVAVARATRHLVKSHPKPLKDLPAICNLPVVKEICEIINNFGNNHFPIDDLDGDAFSPLATLRGSDWRGKDCNDLKKDVHPGARPIDSDRQEDSNCNGIYGVDPITTNPMKTFFAREPTPQA
eukprot:m.63425 g.63425  ORF g.63425 m.63425 type:complete len:251 (-) comp11949_c0_seq1:1415-2167(-)